MITVDIRLNCPECKKRKEKKDFYWNRRGQKVYVECKPCIKDILKKRKEEKIHERYFSY